MIKLCGVSIVKLSSVIFKNFINNSIFSNIGKRSNIISVHKRGGKQIVDNYRPASLSPIFRKILQKLLSNSLMNFLEENNLFSRNQPGFEVQTSVRVNFFR